VIETAPAPEAPPATSRLNVTDLLPLASIGLRSRPMRSALSVLGIAIGVGAIIAILGITRSSQSDLIAQIDRLGTNMLTLSAAPTPAGDPTQLPTTAAETVARVEGVIEAAPIATLSRIQPFRTDRIPAYRTNGLGVVAADGRLLAALDIRPTAGSFISPAWARYPAVALGHDAALQLGIGAPGGRIWIGRHWFVIVGILPSAELAPEIDAAVLIGPPVARELFDYDGHPTRVYVRTDPERTIDVAAVLAPSANPIHPERVAVSRPSDALAARLAAVTSTTSLLLGLGAVALLVGGIGVGNVMLISVLERRGEVGLRRALGASRRHIALQFLIESMLLAAAGGLAGVVIGTALTIAVARFRQWQPLVPVPEIAAALVAGLLIGAIAGVYPATRAARLSPTEALRLV